MTRRPRPFGIARRQSRIQCALLTAAMAFAPASALDLESRGGLDYQFYLTQDSRYRELDDRGLELFPGHRLAVSVDNTLAFSDHTGITLDVTAQTHLARLDEEPFKLNKLHYRIAPGLRHAWGRHAGAALIAHECLHNIDRRSKGGSVFWTLAYFEIESRGMDARTLAPSASPSPVRRQGGRQALDYRLGAGTYLDSETLSYVRQRNDLRRYAQLSLRYSLSQQAFPVLFTDWTQEVWSTETVRSQYKGTVRLNWIVPNRGSTAVLYAGRTYLDQQRFNNEHSLWSVGFSVLH